MKKKLLFLQGGGENGYETDTRLVKALREELGGEFQIDYPKLQTEEKLPAFGWPEQIGAHIRDKVPMALIAHSLGASLLLKCLAEDKAPEKPKGIYLLATPFWSGDEEWEQALKLPVNAAQKLKDLPLFFYHARDDQEIPFAQFQTYEKLFPKGTFRPLETGGHQFSARLKVIAKDIRNQLA